MLIDEVRAKLLYLGEGIIDASTLLNHQVDVNLLFQAADSFAALFQNTEVTKVLTLEVSGIVPALLAAQILEVPMVYARKGKRITQKECFEAPVQSRTTSVDTIITVDKRMIRANERLLIIDDFLARGEAVRGMASIVEQAQAELLGVCCVFEKTFEGGRRSLRSLAVPVHSFIDLTVTEDDQLLVEPGSAYRDV